MVVGDTVLKEQNNLTRCYLEIVLVHEKANGGWYRSSTTHAIFNGAHSGNLADRHLPFLVLMS
jgi:hypothetical protein